MSYQSNGRTGDSSALRRMNLQSVFRVLHSGGVHTITELTELAQLSRPTTRQAVDDLVASGWVVTAEAQRESASVGRPAQAFEFRPDAGFVLGADIGAAKAVVLISDLEGRVVARARATLSPDLAPEERLEVLGKTIDEAVSAFDRPIESISHAVIGTPGTVNREGEVIWGRAMPGWVGQNPARWVEDRYPIQAQCVSDMPMAALAEHWVGAATHSEAVVYVHVGRRLGAAALVDGRPHYGFHGAATQIGLWRATPWREDYDDLLEPGGAGATGDASALFAKAERGDEDARSRVDALADELVAGLLPMVIAMDPELLVIGGGVSRAGEGIAAPVRSRFREETPFAPDVVCSSLGDEAVALGALRAALDAAEERLFAELAPVTRG